MQLSCFSPAIYIFGLTVSLWIISCFSSNAQLAGWTIAEIYSSADGSVQFIELSTHPAAGGLLGAGYQFNSQNSSATQSHSYATGVSQFSGGGFQYLLFATSGFTQLPGAITPDYIIPNNFLFSSSGNLNVQTISGQFGSSLIYSALPTDGLNGLNASGSVVPATAINYAGQIFAVPEPSTLAVAAWAFLQVFGNRLDKSPH
jgi:serralysin